MKTISWSEYSAVERTRAFPGVFDEKRFTLQQLRDAASKACVLFRGWPFIYCSTDTAETRIVGGGLETVVVHGDVVSQIHVDTGHKQWTGDGIVAQWNLLRSGAFLHREGIFEPNLLKEQSKRVLDTTETIYHVAEAIGSLWRLYYALGVPEEEAVTIEFTYGDTKQRELVDLYRRVGLPRGLVCDASKIEASQTYPLYLWRASDAQISAEICLEIFQPFHWEPSLRKIEREIRPFLGRLPLGASV